MKEYGIIIYYELHHSYSDILCISRHRHTSRLVFIYAYISVSDVYSLLCCLAVSLYFLLCPNFRVPFIVSWIYSQRSDYSRTFSFVVLQIGGQSFVIFVHRGIGPSLFRCGSCAGARSNTQQPAPAHHSVATYISYLTASPSVLLL
jgi:hypothetical protein